MFNGHDIMPSYYGDGDDSPSYYGGAQEVNNSYIFGRAEKTTDKAVLFNLVAFQPYGHEYEFAGQHWLPKSKIHYLDHEGEPYFNLGRMSVIQIPHWLLDKVKKKVRPFVLSEENYIE